MIREVLAAFKRYWCMPTLTKIDSLGIRQSPELLAQIAKAQKVMEDNPDFPSGADFAVTAKPRHIPWSRRKKELEADARQKRRAREEFREQS